MGISDPNVLRVREATDIVALIGEYTTLRPVGQRQVGICPLHDDVTPSLSVNGEADHFHCFGCQSQGDAIAFVQAVRGLAFDDAIRILADRGGIAVGRHDEGDE